jgi:hypothetical protein
MFGKHTGFVKKNVGIFHTFKMPSLRFSNIRNNVKKRRSNRLGISKEMILKIAGAFTILNMPNLAWAANEVAKQTPRGGLQGLWDIKDQAVSMVSSVVGTFRGAAQATEGFARSMAILTENIPLLVPYLKNRMDALFIFMMVFACLVLYTVHKSGFQFSTFMFRLKKNGGSMARLMESVPNSNKKNVFALSIIRELPPGEQAKALGQYYAAQKVQGLMSLENMAGSPGWRGTFSNVIKYVVSSVSSSTRQRSASTSIINVTNSLSRTASTATSRSRTASTANSIPRTVRIPSGNLNIGSPNTNVARAIMSLRRG